MPSPFGALEVLWLLEPVQAGVRLRAGVAFLADYDVRAFVAIDIRDTEAIRREIRTSDEMSGPVGSPMARILVPHDHLPLVDDLAHGNVKIAIAIDVADADALAHCRGGDPRGRPMACRRVFRNDEVIGAVAGSEDHLRLAVGDDLAQDITLTIDVIGFRHGADLRRFPAVALFVLGFQPVHIGQRFGDDIGVLVAIHVDEQHAIDVEIECRARPRPGHVAARVAIEVTARHDILVAVARHIPHVQAEVPQPIR